MGNPVVHFEVMGSNAKTLQNFYKSAFGWEIESVATGEEGPIYARALTQAGGINGGIGQSPNGCGGGHVTFYVGVGDVEQELRKLETLGGKRLSGPHTVPNGPTIGFFRDPEDHMVGLVQIDANCQQAN